MAEPVSFKDPYWSNLSGNVEKELGLPSGLLHSIVNKGERSNADQVSSAGARSPYQIIPQTRDAVLKKYGVDAYASGPDAAKAAGLLLKESLQRNKGDIAAAVGEYHGGTNRANWGPVNLAYRSRVLPAGTRIAGPEAPSIVPEYGVPARAADPLTEVMPGRATYAKGGADGAGGLGLPVLPEPRVIAGTDQAAEVQAQSVLDRAEAEKGRVPVLEQWRRSAASSGITGAAIRLLAAKDILGDNTPNPNFRLDPAKLVGTDSTEYEYLSESTNDKDLEHRLWAVEDRRESQKIVAARGIGYALLAGAVSELPTSALLGIGVATAAARVGLGSARLLAQGRTGAAVGRNILENAAATAVAEGIQERIDPFHTWKDAAFNMTAGALFDAALGSPTLIREGIAHRRLLAAGEAHGEQRLAAQQAAEAVVGADAPAAHRAVQQQELRASSPDAVVSEAPTPLFDRAIAEQHLETDAEPRPGIEVTVDKAAQLRRVVADAARNDPGAAQRKLAPSALDEFIVERPANAPSWGLVMALRREQGVLTDVGADRAPEANQTGLTQSVGTVTEVGAGGRVAGEELAAPGVAQQPNVPYVSEGGLEYRFPAAAGNEGVIKAEIHGEFLSVTWADNGDSSGKPTPSGKMLPAYERMVKEAEDRGLTLTSDASVSEAAAHIYSALERRGYSVSKSDRAELETDATGSRWVTPDRSPVFTVKSASTAPTSFSKQRGILGWLRSLFRSSPEPDNGRPDYGWEGFDAADLWAVREKNFRAGGQHHALLGKFTHGAYTDLAALDALPAGITKQAGKDFSYVEKAAELLRVKFLGADFKLILMDADASLGRANGAITMVRENIGIVNMKLGLSRAKQQHVIIHEIGHAIWQKYLAKLTPAMRKDVDADYLEFKRADPKEQARLRYANQAPDSTFALKATKYEVSRDEFSAEQYVKYIEDSVLNGGNFLRLDRAFADTLVDAVLKLIAFFKDGARAFRKPPAGYARMFDAILTKQAALNRAANAVGTGTPAVRSKMEEPNLHADPDIQRLGLHLLPMDTPQARAEVLAIKELYRKAETSNIKVDEKRLSKLLDTAVFEDGQSRANVLLRSKSPVARFVAATLAESPSGAAGRRKTAAISKSLHEQAFLGNSMNEVQAAYRLYRQEAGGSVVEDTWGGKHWEEFNAAIAREIEARGRGSQVNSHPQVIKAADSLETAYERMRTAQVQANTVGAGSLPSTSRGYMPHRLSQEKIRNAGTKELSALHTALTDQFVTDLDFDMSFADMLASKYIDRVKIRALGGADTPAGMAHAGASDVVEEALRAAGMGDAEVKATLQRIAKAGPGHTKKRLQLDLNRTYDTPDGGTFRIGDLFESDQFTLLRAQASRVSGEVALMEHGVPGKAGLDMIRRALRAGEDGQQATLREVDAFDQIAAEFLGAPYGTQSKLIDRVLQANSLVRLGGLAWTQLSETINGAVHLGVGRAFDSVIGIPRLIGEVRALARGEKVDGVLAGMEKLYGAEFGTLSYKTVFAFDNRSMDPHSYGQDTLTLMDRLLRGGGHLQGKLSMWRAIHSAQHRGMAEQIARKAVVYLQEGKSADVYLRDMGMSDELLAKLRADLPRMAAFDGSGRLLDLDVTKATDRDAALEFTQAVHRGVSQIIQGTFIGERSKWATDAHMRLLTQFRTFSLTSVEKQWGRQVGNVGPYKALGILIGTMSAAFPIYAARTYANAVGREDREEYLDKAFQPERIARQLMNYGAAWGLAPDFIDALGALGGWNLGGRSGDQEQDFVGNVVAPGAGLINDVYRAVQNTEEGADVKQFMEAMPFNNLPFLVPLINALGD